MLSFHDCIGRNEDLQRKFCKEKFKLNNIKNIRRATILENFVLTLIVMVEICTPLNRISLCFVTTQILIWNGTTILGDFYVSRGKVNMSYKETKLRTVNEKLM